MISGKPDGEPAGQKNCKGKKKEKQSQQSLGVDLLDASTDTFFNSSPHLALFMNKLSQN